MTAILNELAVAESITERSIVLGSSSCPEVELKGATEEVVILGGQVFKINGNLGKLSIVCLRSCLIVFEGCADSLAIDGPSRADVVGDLGKARVSHGGNLTCKGVIQDAYARLGGVIFADSITNRQACFGGVILDKSQCTPYEESTLE